MARLRGKVSSRPRTSIALPVELLDVADPVWSDADLFVAWLRRHRLTLAERRPTSDPCYHMHSAVEAWAQAHDLMLPDGGADWRRLRIEFGIRYCRRLKAIS